MRVSFRSAARFAALTIACLAAISSPARAITITVNSIAKLGGDTANGVTSSGSNRNSGWDSQVFINNSGTTAADAIGATATGQTRYASTLSSDADAASFGSETKNVSSNYRVVFTVTPGSASTVYDLKIDTSRIGARLVRDEGGSNGEAQLNAVSGTINGVGNGGLALADLGNLSSNSTNVQAFNQSNTVTLSGLTGTQVFTLDFAWNSRTASGNNILSGGDEGVVLMGLDTRINSRVGAADDYPGTSGRTNPAGDGHFVNLTATVTVVPEPSTLALGAFAGLGIACFGWRRRKS